MQLFQWLRGEEMQYKQGTWAQTLTGVLAIMYIFRAFMTLGRGPEPRECFSVNNFLSRPSVQDFFFHCCSAFYKIMGIIPNSPVINQLHLILFSSLHLNNITVCHQHSDINRVILNIT